MKPHDTVKIDNVMTVKFTKKNVRAYLDHFITFWRGKHKFSSNNLQEKHMSEDYIDACQSIRISLFGERPDE